MTTQRGADRPVDTQQADPGTATAAATEPPGPVAVDHFDDDALERWSGEGGAIALPRQRSGA